MGPPQLPQLRCPGGCAGALPPALVLQCSAPSEHLQIMAFSFLLCLFVYLFFAFFFFFGSKLPPPDALEKARQCAGGCCPTGHQCRAQGPSQPWVDEATENGHRAMPW